MLSRSLLAVSLVLISIVSLVGCGPPYDARLVDPSGSRLRVTSRQGLEVVTGQPGDTYVLLVTNRSSEPVAAYVAVDGLDMMSGAVVVDSEDGRRGRGYMILQPNSYTDLRGFAVGRSRTSTFRFAEPEQALAARKGDASSLGRIDVQLYPLARVAAQAPTTPAVDPDAHPDNQTYVNTPAAPRRPGAMFGAEVEEHWDLTLGRELAVPPHAVPLKHLVLTYEARAGGKLGTAGPPPSPVVAPVASIAAPAPDNDDAPLSSTSSGKPPKGVRGPKPSKGDVAPVKGMTTTKAPKPSSAAVK